MDQVPGGGLAEAVEEPPCPSISGALFWFLPPYGLAEHFRVA